MMLTSLYMTMYQLWISYQGGPCTLPNNFRKAMIGESNSKMVGILLQSMYTVKSNIIFIVGRKRSLVRRNRQKKVISRLKILV